MLACQRRSGATLVATLLSTGLLGFYAISHLGFNVDPNALFSPDLRFQEMIAKFSRYFPVLTDSLLVVVDGKTPEATREAQLALAERLRAQPEVFRHVFLPGEEPFFERTGLLYGSVDDVDEFADSMALIQPLIGELSRDPTLPTLTRVIQEGLEATRSEEVDVERWERVLDHFRSATVSVFDEYPVAVSWETLLLADSGFDVTPLRVIVADPILDLERVLAAETAIEAVRAAAESLGLGAESGVRVRVSGYPALNHEEMIGLANDTGIAGGLSFILVVMVLTRAFRSPQMVTVAAVTLLVGLVWSAAFAAATVAELNPLSIAFGVLVIGLGVDFMIHLGMHLSEGLRAGQTIEDATRNSVRDAGPALVLCAATTAVGFLAFVPTDYRGISDLGLVASGGMVALLFQTLTLFPALLKLLLGRAALAKLANAAPATRHSLRVLPPVPVCIVAGILGVGAIALLPRVDLETNVIEIRNSETESVEAFEDLLASRVSTPWYLDALAPSLAEADRLAAQMRSLDVVDRVVTLSDLVPEDQAEKLEILRDISLFLDIPDVAPRRPPPAEVQIESLTTLRDFLDADPIGQSGSPLARSARRLRDALDRFLADIQNDGAVPLAELERLLLDPLPSQLDRLRESLEVGTIEVADLPPELVSRMLAGDGHARIQVYPTGDLGQHEEMVEFVEAIRPIWGDITGLPVNLVESARATWSSLREALTFAVCTITALLLLLWRRIDDTLIALVPLLLAVAMTEAATVVLPVSFNFANIIVLPLILGIGVDSGVHLVYRARRLTGGTEGLLATTTARAVFYSAVTTIASFGTLTISPHTGVRSLGILLVIGMIWTLAANLLLLPALLALRTRWRSRAVPDRGPEADRP